MTGLPVVEGVAPELVACALDLAQLRPQIGAPALRQALPMLSRSQAAALARALKVYHGLDPSSPANRSIGRVAAPPPPADVETPPPLTVTQNGNRFEASGVCDDPSIETFLELIRFDADRWRIVNWQVRRWSSAVMKLRTKTGDDLIDEAHEPTPRWYHRVSAAPLIEPSLIEAVDRLVARLGEQSPVYKPIAHPRPSGESYMLEIGLHDVHFGMRAWGAECGENFDVEIARGYVARAIEDVLAETYARHVGRVVLPIGSDFFHLDNAAAVTNRSRNPLDIDTRPAYVFEAGVACMIDVIERCRQLAPVDALYLPANHDITWAHHLAVCLRERFRNCPDVTIDISPKPRKYLSWGVGLLGLTHGDVAKGNWASLPVIMAGEAKEEWSQARYCEIHTGHLHHSEGNEIAGIPVRRLPTLTPPDAWHTLEGYHRIQRVMEAYWWSDQRGVAGITFAHARSPEAAAAA